MTTVDRMRARMCLGLALALAAAGSCTRGEEKAAAAAPVVHAVAMEAVAFAPEAVAIKVGDEVAWVNKDPFPHTVKAGDSFESPAIQPDGRFTRTFTAAGDYDYICTLHPTMKGTIKVR